MFPLNQKQSGYLQQRSRLSLILFILILSFTSLVLCQNPDKQRTRPQDELFGPTLTVACPDTIEVGHALIFTANIGGAFEISKDRLQWTVSGGTIIEGQGTLVLRVEKLPPQEQSVTATLEFVGDRPAFSRSASCSIIVERFVDSYKAEEYGNLSLKEEHVRLDALVRKLKDNTRADLSILAFDGLKMRAGIARKRAERARRYLVKKGIEMTRISITADRDFTGASRTKELKLQFYLRAHNLSPLPGLK